MVCDRQLAGKWPKTLLGMMTYLVAIAATAMVGGGLKISASTRETIGAVDLAGGGSLALEEARWCWRIARKAIAVG